MQFVGAVEHTAVESTTNGENRKRPQTYSKEKNCARPVCQ